jgi:hypothetical protein
MPKFMVRVITIIDDAASVKAFDTGEILEAPTVEDALQCLYARGEDTEETNLTVRELTKEETEKLTS